MPGSEQLVAEGCPLALPVGDLPFLAVLVVFGDVDRLDDLHEELRVACQFLVEDSGGPFVGFKEREVPPLQLGQPLPTRLRLGGQVGQQARHVVREHRQVAGREIDGGLAQCFGDKVRVGRVAVLDGDREQAQGVGRMAELDEGTRCAFPSASSWMRKTGAFSQ